MSHLFRSVLIAWLAAGTVILAGCVGIPSSGPSTTRIAHATERPNNPLGIQVIDLTDDIARKLFAERSNADFSTTFGDHAKFRQELGVGDTIEVSIWEAPPATLFGATQISAVSEPGNARVTVLPGQMIDGDGNINVPFIGAIKAAGKTPTELQRQIAARLRLIAHDPQVLVRLSSNVTSYVTVVGDVTNSTRMQLTPKGERLLDALASAGGVRQPIDKITLQVTRGSTVASMPLDMVIRDPRQNVSLQAGDVVTALFQPFSFTVLGATGKNQEINFEAQGITLAQALARAGGLDDNRSDARGVFIFRLENADALPWPTTPVRTMADGRVPVIYRVDLKNPDTFFVAQSFVMNNKDLLYVSNAPVTDLQKTLNLVFSVVYPVVTGVQTFR